jgi:hypothetical protein
MFLFQTSRWPSPPSSINFFSASILSRSMEANFKAFIKVGISPISIDRERIDALKKFIEEGGDELYYLNDKVS